MKAPLKVPSVERNRDSNPILLDGYRLVFFFVLMDILGTQSYMFWGVKSLVAKGH